MTSPSLFVEKKTTPATQKKTKREKQKTKEGLILLLHFLHSLRSFCSRAQEVLLRAGTCEDLDMGGVCSFVKKHKGLQTLFLFCSTFLSSSFSRKELEKSDNNGIELEQEVLKS